MGQYTTMSTAVATHLAATHLAVKNAIDNEWQTEITEEYKEKQEYKKQRLKELKRKSIMKIIGFVFGTIALYGINCFLAYYSFKKVCFQLFLSASLVFFIEVLIILLLVVVISFLMNIWKDHVKKLKEQVDREHIDMNAIKAQKLKKILS